MNRILRKLSLGDMPEIVRIESRAFTDPWPAEAFTGLSEESSWILELGGILIGYILYHFIIDEAVILNFAIDPDYTGRGNGAYLLNNSMNELAAKGCRKFFLDVRMSNAQAISLYHKSGFTELGIRKGYYKSPPEDALVMGRVL
ncbi:MAG TPA: ribosomal protein S18-alanine N-acetyltransferase [Candidatus Cloacimonadota bacterium]|nr:ribosomal protein S18-alanine N-acetyltransferase [Candidatus Cloacimonadota bacterium]